MNLFLKVINIIFFILFLVSAGLQYNDPDPYLWMPIYLFTAALCFYAFRDKFYPKVYLAGILVFSIYATYLFFTDNGVTSWASQHQAENIAQSMKATKPYIENTREFFGLVIMIVALLINLVYYNLRVKKH